MSFFSRIRIVENIAAPKLLFKLLKGDLYSSHQLIWKLFPSDPNAKRQFLFRQEFEKEQLLYPKLRRGMPVFYVISEKKPEMYDDLLIVETKPYEPKLEKGTRLCFDLRVNPVIQEKVKRANAEEWARNRKLKGLKEKKETKLRRYHDILMVTKKQLKADGVEDRDVIRKCMQNTMTEWFKSKGKDCGFQPNHVEYSAYQQHVLKKSNRSLIKFSSVDLMGVLTVTEPVLFKNTLIGGIGPAKAFGCGLLLVKPI